MEVARIEDIKNLVDEIATLRDRDFQDYADLRDLYEKHICLNQLLAIAVKQYNSKVDKYFLEDHTMMRRDPVLISTGDLGDVVDQCVIHNNALLEVIDGVDSRLKDIDRYRYTPVKNVDTVKVLQMCYDNVCMCIRLKDMGVPIPEDYIYTDMKIDSMNVPDLVILYTGVKEANEILKGMLEGK